MAFLDIFKKKKTKTSSKAARREEHFHKSKEEDKSEEAARVLKEDKAFSEKAFRVLLKPVVTEKSAGYDSAGVYVFKVQTSANKIEIRQAIEELYGVKVKKVNVVSVPQKSRFMKGRKGIHSGYKKAMVFLGKGEKIDIT